MGARGMGPMDGAAKLVTNPSNTCETPQPSPTPRAAKSLWHRLSERRAHLAGTVDRPAAVRAWVAE
jgi:hypothetical protein